MNAEELTRHYAAVRARIAPPVKTVAAPPAPKEPVVVDPLIELAKGLPQCAPRASIAQMLLAYDVPWSKVAGDCRKHRTSLCRRVIYWLLHCRGWSTPKIGRLMNKDHSSVVHSLTMIRNGKDKR
jgi:hypothetical protein